MLGNPLGTYREYIVRTYWEPRKMENLIKSSPRPLQTNYLFNLYTRELNFGQTICKKKWGAIYWEHIGEQIGEPFGSSMGTWWEHIENKEKTPPKKKSLPPSPQLLAPSSPSPSLREKSTPPMSSCWAFSLAAWNFYFQSCLSPFLVYS